MGAGTDPQLEIINVGPPINVPYEGVSCDVNCSSVIYYTSSYQLIFYSITHTHTHLTALSGTTQGELVPER